MRNVRLDLKAIEDSLRDVQREFPKINALLHSRRDALTDEVLDNLLAGYRFVDTALASAVDGPAHMRCCWRIHDARIPASGATSRNQPFWAMLNRSPTTSGFM
jgi:hypothetical protein